MWSQSSLSSGFVIIGALCPGLKIFRNEQGFRRNMEEKKKRSDFYGPDSDRTFAMKRRRFTNTALLVFSGAECWFQHFHIVQAIVKSNGWSEETAALQLFAHLKGEALNVALLLPRERRNRGRA